MHSDDTYSELIKLLNYPNPGSEYLRRIIEKSVSSEDVRLILALPAQPTELAQKMGTDCDTVMDTLKVLMERGIVVSTSRGFRFVRDVMQLHDASLSSSAKWTDTQLLDLWKAFYDAEWREVLGTTASRPYLRVVPAWKAIERSPTVSPVQIQLEDNIRELAKRAELIAVCPCSCRRSMRRCQAEVETCVQFDRGAEYALTRGAAQRISLEEATALFDRAEEEGLVHLWPFFKPSAPPNSMCNCCVDCCVIIDPGLKFGSIERILYRSGLEAEVDQDACNGCQVCVDRCFFGAIGMGKFTGSKRLKAVVDPGKCFGCGVCVVSCEVQAMRMKTSRLSGKPTELPTFGGS